MAQSKYEYINFLNYTFLTLLRWWARATSFIFFRRYKVHQRENIPQNGPVIFAPNHQSAFLDPVLIGVTCGRKPWYLTRASVFKGQLVKYLLRSIHMIPVFRPRDKVNIAEANKAVFSQCREILEGQGSVLLFPEGNHGMQKRLRTPLKKGLARIAFEAESENEFALGLKIVPVGINYEHPTQYRTDVLITYGKPLELSAYKEQYLSNPKEAMNVFTRDVEKALIPLMIHIAPEDQYGTLEKQWMEQRTPSSSLVQRFEEDKALIEKLQDGNVLGSSGEPSKSENSVVKLAGKILGFPFFVFGALFNMPYWIIQRYFLKVALTDPHFILSVKFALSGLLFPLLVLAEAMIVNHYLGYFWWSVAAIGGGGILAADYARCYLGWKKYTPINEIAGEHLP